MGKWRRMKIVARFKNGTERVEEFAKMDDFKDSLDSYYHSLKNGNTFSIGDIDEVVETQLESFIAYNRDGSVYCRSEEMKTSPSFQKSWIYLPHRETKLFAFKIQFPCCSLELSDSSNSEWSGNGVNFQTVYRRPQGENMPDW